MPELLNPQPSTVYYPGYEDIPGTVINPDALTSLDAGYGGYTYSTVVSSPTLLTAVQPPAAPVLATVGQPTPPTQSPTPGAPTPSPAPVVTEPAVRVPLPAAGALPRVLPPWVDTAIRRIGQKLARVPSVDESMKALRHMIDVEKSIRVGEVKLRKWAIERLAQGAARAAPAGARALGSIAGSIGVLVGGLLYPSKIGGGSLPDTLRPDELTPAPRIEPVEKPAVLNRPGDAIGTPPLPPLPGKTGVLEPIDLPPIAKRSPIGRGPVDVGPPAPAARPRPVGNTRRSQTTTPKARTAKQIASTIGTIVGPSLLPFFVPRSRLTLPRLTPFQSGTLPSSPALPSPTTTAPPGTDPALRTSPLPFSGGRGSQPTKSDRCNCEKKRGKKRRCIQRANVVWQSGPKKGKLAGTRCVQFAKETL